MISINIKPVEIIGECPANLTLDDQFQITGMALENPNDSRVCFLAISHFPLMVWQLQAESRFFSHASCPGCISNIDRENRVVFLLGHKDKWELSQMISQYLQLSRTAQEPETARRFKEEAIEFQKKGQFSRAEHKMKSALRELRRVAAS